MDKIMVLGIGNILLTDEGLGVEALKRLTQEYEFEGNVEFMDGGTMGVELVYYLEGVNRLLVLDAILGGGPPGSFYKFVGSEVKKYFRRKVSMHELGFQEVLGLLDVMDKPVKDIVVMGIEPESLELGVGLSSTIEESMPKLLDEAVNQLEEWGIKVKGGVKK